MGKHCQVTCNICNKSVRSNNLPRHLRTHGIGGKGSNEIRSNSRNNINPDNLIDTSVTYPSYQNRFEKFDIRLKENFKLFIAGPSRCGKTFFCVRPY